MRAWGDPDGLHAAPPIDRLRIKREEMDRVWQHDQRIRLGRGGLCEWGRRRATEQPTQTTQHYQAPQTSSGDGIDSRGMIHSLQGSCWGADAPQATISQDMECQRQRGHGPKRAGGYSVA